MDSERNSLLTPRVSTQHNQNSSEAASYQTQLSKQKTEKRLMNTYLCVEKYVLESKDERLERVLAPLLIFVVSYLIKFKTDMVKVRTFFQQHMGRSKFYYQDEIELTEKHIQEMERDKPPPTSDTLKRISKLQWTIEISKYSFNKFMLFLEINQFTFAEHILKTKVDFKSKQVRNSLSAVDKAQAHMATDRVISFQQGPEIETKGHILASRLPRFDQLDISNRSGIHVDTDGQDVLLAGTTPVTKRISPQQVKRQIELKKYGQGNPKALPSIGLYTLHNAQTLVTCMTVAASGTKVAAGFEDGTLRIFEIDPYEGVEDQVQSLKGQRAHVFKQEMLNLSAGSACYSVCFSPDDTLLISGGQDGIIRLWSVHFRCKLASYAGHNFPIWDVKFPRTRGIYFASGSSDRSARVWRTDRQQAIRVMVGHLEDVEAVEFSPNLQYLATASADKTVRIWEISTAVCKREFLSCKAGIRALHFPGKMLDILLCGSEQGDLLVLHLDSGKVLNRLKRPSQRAIWSLSSSIQGVVAAGCQDDCIELYDMNLLRAQEVEIKLDCMRTLMVTLQEVNEADDSPEAEDVQRILKKSALIKRMITKRTSVLETIFMERGLVVGVGSMKRTIY